MVKRSSRKRSVKHYQKEFEYSQDMDSTPDRRYESPVRSTQKAMEEDNTIEIPLEEEKAQEYSSRFEDCQDASENRESAKSPLPHEVFRNSPKEKSTV